MDNRKYTKKSNRVILSICLAPDVKSKLDGWAQQLGESRSQLISDIVSQYGQMFYDRQVVMSEIGCTLMNTEYMTYEEAAEPTTTKGWVKLFAEGKGDVNKFIDFLERRKGGK